MHNDNEFDFGNFCTEQERYDILDEWGFMEDVLGDDVDAYIPEEFQETK